MVTKDCDKGCRENIVVSFLFFRNPFVFVVLWLVLAVAIGAIIMLLWNWLMPVIFGLPVLSLWQALGLFVLTRILLGASALVVEECQDGVGIRFMKNGCI